MANFNKQYQGQFGQINVQTIQEILKISTKKRFEIENNQIRAKYGHTLPIQLKYPTLTKNIPLFHGTSFASLGLIKTEGLKPMTRQFVHLTDSVDLARETALRKGSEIVILTIDTPKLIQNQEVLVAGFGIYLTGNILSEFLIPNF